MSNIEKWLDYCTSKNMVFAVLISSLMMLIFVLDLQFTTEMYIGVLYISIIMFSLSLNSNKYTLIFASISTALACFGFFYSIYLINPQAYLHTTNLVNLLMTILAIWVTTLIAIYIQNISIALRNSESIHKAILNSSLDPIIIMDASGKIKSASATIEQYFGWNPREIIGKNFIVLLDESCKETYSTLFKHTDNIAHSPLIGHTIEGLGMHRMRRDFPCEISINYIQEEQIEMPLLTAVLRDISIRKNYEQKMAWLLTHDELTNIYNRRYLNEQIAKEWQRSIRHRNTIGMIIVDVDFFKHYNDAFGHQAGDECLKMIASCLSDSVQRPADVAARYGGEEFIMLLPETNLAGTIAVAKRLQTAISNLNILHPQSTINNKVTVSMGLACMASSLGCSYERLIRFADQALYQAKTSGRNRYCVYDDDTMAAG